jgi:hypothetical protein
MSKQSLRLALLMSLFFCCIHSVRSETVADRMGWPPVFERTYGTPTLDVREGSVDSPKVTFIRPARLVMLKMPVGFSCDQVSETLRTYFLGLLWDDYLSQDALTENEVRLNMGELIPMSRPLFLEIGHCQLTGKSCGNCVHDSWWRVRTGLKLKESCDHLLAITALELEDPEENSFGHFAFALRKRGGDCKSDSIFDFRAPWYEDRRPRFTEAPNIHNVLKLKGVRVNLYDWLYTQTEYRNCHVSMHFVKVHEEQIAILKAFNGNVHEAGNFRVFKKNCASLGVQFINRILPLDEEIKGEDALADLPLKIRDATVEHFGGSLKELRVENMTLKVGRTPTNKSEIKPAQPSCKGCRPFKALSKVAEIN